MLKAGIGRAEHMVVGVRAFEEFPAPRWESLGFRVEGLPGFS